MQSFVWFLLFLLSETGLAATVGQRVYLPGVQELEFHRGAQACGPRAGCFTQMTCMGTECPTMVYLEPFSATCRNAGYGYGGGADWSLQWDCRFDLPDATVYFVETFTIQCEGFDFSGDDFVVEGSCTIDYRLKMKPVTMPSFPTPPPPPPKRVESPPIPPVYRAPVPTVTAAQPPPPAPEPTQHHHHHYHSAPIPMQAVPSTLPKKDPPTSSETIVLILGVLAIFCFLFFTLWQCYEEAKIYEEQEEERRQENLREEVTPSCPRFEPTMSPSFVPTTNLNVRVETVTVVPVEPVKVQTPPEPKPHESEGLRHRTSTTTTGPTTNGTSVARGGTARSR